MELGQSIKLQIEWDPTKAVFNLRKHKVGFLLAARVFADLNRIVSPDPFEDEERWRTIGKVRGRKLPLVVHTIRQYEHSGNLQEVVRIISARLATREEVNIYEREAG